MTRPNILFILSDQHAQRAAGCYGDPSGVTPHLDRLAAEGVVFENAYCPSPICGPSRMSLMTGKQPHETGCWLNSDILNSGQPTYAHALGAAGYRAALIGRMHFIGPDQTHGFSTRLVGDHSANWPGNPTFDHEDLRGTSGPAAISVTKSGPGTNAYVVKDRDATSAAVDWLRDTGARQKGGDAMPFHLTLGFMLPHPPYVCDPDDFAEVSGRVPDPVGTADELGPDHPWLRRWREITGITEMNPEDVARARQAYWGMLYRLDQNIGAVLSALDAAGLAENTLVIYASDHGDHLGNRGLFWKHSFYDDSVKVPMVMRWPAHLPKGARRTGLVSLTDLGATMLDAAAGDWTGGGQSLLPLAKDAAAPWVDEVVSEYCVGLNDSYSFADVTMNRMIRCGRFKLIYYHGYPCQLFDLESDPLERVDLSEDRRYAQIRDRLLHRVLADWAPEQIKRQILVRDREAALLSAWAQQTSPQEQHRWDMPRGESSGLAGEYSGLR
ncbi:sulfatase-like hydrolase/transferase [Jannaschia sp.]|nr:sulfatase-like hydrolase/transferase [Jannaschia sp.]